MCVCVCVCVHVFVGWFIFGWLGVCLFVLLLLLLLFFTGLGGGEGGEGGTPPPFPFNKINNMGLSISPITMSSKMTIFAIPPRP